MLSLSTGRRSSSLHLSSKVFSALNRPTTVLYTRKYPSFPHIPLSYLYNLVPLLIPDYSTHRYATDCTPNGSRARIFSTMQGMLYVGLASGPWLNGLILHLGSGSTTRTLFVAAIIIALINLTFVTFVLPESLSPSSRLKEGSRDSRSESVSSGTTSDSSSTRSSIHQHGRGGGRRGRRRGIVGAVKGLAQYVARQFWRPVRLFLPHWVEAGNGKKGRWDWNLTLVGITLFIYLLSIVSVFLLLLQICIHTPSPLFFSDENILKQMVGVCVVPFADLISFGGTASVQSEVSLRPTCVQLVQ